MAYGFNGTNQYLGASGINLNTPVTLAGLMYANSNTSKNSLITIQNLITAGTDYSVFYLALRGDVAGDPVRAGVSNAAGSTGQSDTSTGYTQQQWEHAAGKYSSSVSRRAYLNGSPATENTASRTPSNALHITIGAIRYIETITEFANANISEVALWNVALTDDEIASLAKGFKPTRIRPQSLIFYAPLIRDLKDWRGGLTITPANSPTVANHPRVY